MYLYVHMVLSYSHTHGVVSDNNEANDDDGDEDEEMTRRGGAGGGFGQSLRVALLP